MTDPVITVHAAAVLVLTVLALFLFTRPRIPLETTSLAVLVLLTVGFELFPFEARVGRLQATDFFKGFGHQALIAVGALMIAGRALVRTGALEPVGAFLARHWRSAPRRSLLLTLAAAALLSAFVNNTPIVVLLLPILVGVSLRSNTSSSQILLPVGFATLIGGMCTTIGTSTNLLVVSVAADLGMHRLGMLEFAPLGMAAGALGLLYLWLVVPRIVRERKPILDDTSPRLFTARLKIPEGSFADGRTLSEVVQRAGGRMVVQQIRKESPTYTLPLPDARIRPNDFLVVRDTPERLKEYERALGATLYTGSSPVDEDHPLQADEQQLAEVVVVEGSPLYRRTLRGIRFLDTYQLATLAIHRAGQAIVSLSQDIGDVRLRAGDVLLVQGAREQIAKIRQEGSLLILDATFDLPFTRKAPLALAIMIGIIALAALRVLPIAVSAVTGVLLMLVSGCLHWRDITRSLQSSVILIIVASLALAAALEYTGGTEWLAAWFLRMTQAASPRLTLSLLILSMVILTNVVTNNAAAVIGTPVALRIAEGLGLPPEPFVLAVLFGANLSFVTPMAYQTNLLVMNAGGYTFWDFVRAGAPLAILLWLAFSALLPWWYGF